IHIDRWWNPAVEDQATDRAYRIGQEQDVDVYKFFSAGTLDERIHEIITGKRELAGAVVGEGEGWIASLSDDDLAELWQLRESSDVSAADATSLATKVSAADSQSEGGGRGVRGPPRGPGGTATPSSRISGPAAVQTQPPRERRNPCSRTRWAQRAGPGPRCWRPSPAPPTVVDWNAA